MVLFLIVFSVEYEIFSCCGVMHPFASKSRQNVKTFCGFPGQRGTSKITAAISRVPDFIDA
jgi:hypothetical protein